jgi:hypothetical protein
MNERMIALYEKAMLFASGKVPEFNSGLWQAVCTGRFAELLVEECTRLADLKEKGHRLNLRDYFGVEQ